MTINEPKSDNKLDDLTDTLIRCYVTVGVAVDQLPYSPDLDQIVNMYRQQTGDHLSPSTAFRWLFNLRKSSKLPKLKVYEPLNELYIAAGRIPARFCKLWITSNVAMYKGKIEGNMLAKGEFVGKCNSIIAAHHIAKAHNEALLELWTDEDTARGGCHSSTD